MYAFQTRCHGAPVFAAVEIKPIALMSLSSRRTLGLLANNNWLKEDKTVPATIIARVSSEVQSCFGPGLVLTAVTVSVDGPVKHTTRQPNSAQFGDPKR